MTREENVRVVLDMYEAWNTGRLEEILLRTPERLEFHTSGSVPELPPLLVGKSGMTEIFETWWRGGWSEMRADIERVDAIDEESVLGLGTFRATGAASGIEVNRPIGHVITLRDGEIVEIRAFGSWEETLAAAGVET